MLTSYLITALRNLRNHPAYSAINIFGLAMSFSVCLLLILLVQDQRSYDLFHENADRIYRVIGEASGRTDGHGVAATPAYLASAIERDGLGVEKTLRLARIRSNLVHGGRSIKANGLYADPTFFDFFDFELVAGEAQNVLSQPNRLILSEAAAARIFATHDPMGDVVTLEGVGDLVIAGVVRTAGRKSHLKFDMLTSLATLEATADGRAQLQEEANFWSFANYILLKKGASGHLLEAYLARVSQRYADTEQAYKLKLQALTDITLGPRLGNEISSLSMPLFIVLMLAGLAGVVLLASGFNYVGLTIARSVTRAKEVGIRKSMGASREQVVMQFLAESVLMALCALVFAYALLAWLVSGFDSLSIMQTFHVNLGVNQIFNARLVGIFLAFGVTVGLIAGAYPALYLSWARPVLVLKGIGLGSGASRMWLRKGLTLFQLIFSLIFIITTALIYRQLTFMVNFDFGFHSRNVVNIELQGASYATLKSELMRLPSVATVGAADALPAGDTIYGAQVSVNQQDTIFVARYNVDADFLDALDIQVLAGRNFSPAYAGSSEGVLINETAARRLGFKIPPDAVGQVLDYDVGPQPIIGIVKDFQFRNLARPVEPMLLLHDPAGFAYATVRLQPDATSAFLTDLKAVWKRLDPVHPVEYQFYDTQIRDNDATRVFRDLVSVVGLAALIAVTIACLGLISMAAFNTQLRRREIGVRRVLGADARGLFWLLSKEYIYLAVTAVMVAAPAAWFLNKLWLEQIANRVAFGPILIGFSTAVLLVLAMLAVGLQTLRATRADPVDSLRWE